MNLNILKIAVTFAGCFLGAGYVSGQELWQFFISFGKSGILGLICAMILIFVFGVLLMKLASTSGISGADAIIIRKNNYFLRSFVGISEIFFLIGIAVIMSAGAGALFKQLFDISEYISSFIFCIVVLLFSAGGYKRMINVFTFTVPLLVLFTLIIAIVSFIGFSGSFDSVPMATDKNPLLAKWWISAIAFVAYNIFSSVQILAPVGVNIQSNNRIFAGVAIGTLILFVIAFSIFLSVLSFPLACAQQLPMLTVASELSPVLGLIYAVLLLMGMFGTALSSFVSVLHYLASKTSMSSEKSNRIFSIILSVVLYAGSLVGFGDLVGTVYPICGYFGVVAIILMAEHFLHIYKNNKKRN